MVQTWNGTAGADLINGGADPDLIYGRGGADSLYGHEGDDQIWAGGGADQVQGGLGADLLFGNGGDDLLFGGAGAADTLVGGQGDDLIEGGTGNDLFKGGRDNDTLSGGAGDDLFRVSAQDGFDLMEGGDGVDVINLSKLNSGVILSDSFEYPDMLMFSGMDGLSSGQGTGIERVIATEHADYIVSWGLSGGIYVDAGAGNDLFFGDNSEIAVVAGKDTILDGAGDDLISAGAGDGLIISGAGQDVFLFSGWNTHDEGDDTIRGFDAALDLIEIALVHDAPVPELTDVLTQTAQGVIVTYGSGTILLSGLTVDALNEQNLVFVLETLNQF